MNIKQVLEFRGYTERITQKGSKQYMLNFEGENGVGLPLLTNNADFVKTIQKGQKYIVDFSVDATGFVNGIYSTPKQ